MATPQNPTAGPERLPSACPDFEVLSCFADGELEAGRVGTVTAHVRSRERCATLAARLSAGFRAVDVRPDGGIGGSGCADDEGLILYLMRGLDDTERALLESHLNGCDHCVATLSLLHRRLSVSDTISAPVPDAVQEAARRLLEHGSLNPTPAPPSSLTVETGDKHLSDSGACYGCRSSSRLRSRPGRSWSLRSRSIGVPRRRPPSRVGRLPVTNTSA